MTRSIFDRDIRNESKEDIKEARMSLLLHEAQHAVYNKLTSFTSLHSGNSTHSKNRNERHFHGYKNELLSALIENGGFRVKTSRTIEEARENEKKKKMERIKFINWNFKDKLHDVKKRSLDINESIRLYYIASCMSVFHEGISSPDPRYMQRTDFIKGAMYSNNFEELEKAIEETVEEITGSHKAIDLYNKHFKCR